MSSLVGHVPIFAHLRTEMVRDSRACWECASTRLDFNFNFMRGGSYRIVRDLRSRNSVEGSLVSCRTALTALLPPDGQRSRK